MVHELHEGRQCERQHVPKAAKQTQSQPMAEHQERCKSKDALRTRFSVSRDKQLGADGFLIPERWEGADALSQPGPHRDLTLDSCITLNNPLTLSETPCPQLMS